MLIFDMIKRIGHRGAQGYVAENTIASFQKALDLKVDAIELDVHLCASGELVVFHDFTLDGLTNGSGDIHKFSLSQLKQFQVLEQYQIPTLEEVLLLINKKCIVNIELKGRNTAETTLKVISKFIKNYGWTKDQFLISSFQSEELAKVRRIDSKIPLAILTQTSIKQAIDWAIEFNAQAIHPHFSLLTAENCILAQQRGLKINAWTVNELADIERIKHYQINGIISDFPDKI
jgi:glycerophosphoryl diester phosphodiesterase